ncbi:hypothetical protein GJQ57_16215 [Ralstonia pickettii]|uniref:Lipoprotein n=1 Tax=Ralstonia pickettii TaxID=329 RepID=A0A7X2HPF6_RALPI|nr:hypothetical protein [Ralstonia pickettii]MRT00187.1 hypothetical protein [Ralstonia pickettii]
MTVGRRIGACFVFVLTAMVMSACGGGDSSDAATASTGGAGSTKNVLFAPDTANNHIGATSTLNPAPGTTLQVGLLTTPVVVAGQNVQYDSVRDWLYAGQGSSSPFQIAVFSSAGTLSGAISPARTWQLPTDLIRISKIVLDTVNDTLYVGGSRTYDSIIYVYPKASTLTGMPVPSKTFGNLPGLADFDVDVPRGLIYYTGTAPFGIYKMPLATGVAQTVACGGCVPVGVSIDSAHDRIYVADLKNVHVIAGASTSQSKDVAQLAMSNPRLLTYDKNYDRLYVSAYTNVYVLNAVNSISSSQAAASGTAIYVNGVTSIGGFGLPQ